ncbi:MAG TPA: winged helix-turn-helix domain-containing protein [Candidatus Acidoferrum sp.]|nr:winged helix-turn-helix domain-containing protein [Candidatus Acidoferrum sp.]
MTPNVISAMETGVDERSNLVPPSGPRFMRFGPFQVDQQRQEVTKHGSRLKLQGKVYQVLVALLVKPGEVVTREELRQRLWPADTHVNYDANVNTTVNKLRQVLGDSTDKPLYIETIPRKGYCLMVPSEASDAPGALLPPEPAIEATSSIAVASPATEPPPPRSGFWIPIGVVGLILAGMLLGAGITITTLMISHFAQVTRWP